MYKHYINSTLKGNANLRGDGMGRGGINEPEIK